MRAQRPDVGAMDEITSADVDQATIERCRDLLGDDGIDLTGGS
jgi:hypothetical protein